MRQSRSSFASANVDFATGSRNPMLHNFEGCDPRQASMSRRLSRYVTLRELNRGGQVFFLHNRVMTIETMRSKLQSLVPSARIVVGHGQMDADELEEVMTKFRSEEHTS